MEFSSWQGFCLCPWDRVSLPEGAVPVSEPFAPLVFLLHRPAEKSRGWFSLSSLEELSRPEDLSCLLPTETEAPTESVLDAFVKAQGACALNTAFARAYDFLAAKKPTGDYRVHLVGLGDVGGTLLTALKLLGREIREIGVYDPNESLCKRYEMELNQVLPLQAEPQPEIRLCTREELFRCDLFLFAASRGVPAVGSGVSDVRMAQFELNRQMLRSYAQQARKEHFTGLFCQIADPVDQLCRVVFLESNRDAGGNFDACGLLPEQIRGFGLGVMAARAAYFAKKEGLDFSQGRVYGPHGKELVVADHPLHYCKARSEALTQQTVTANLQVRELGYKPYIAPALSSAAVSILQLLRGQYHLAAVPVGSAYFGCRSRLTPLGTELFREPIHPALYEKLQTVHAALEGFSYD